MVIILPQFLGWQFGSRPREKEMVERNVKILEEGPKRWKMNHPGILMKFIVFRRVCPMWV
jgi:hypothetical protein